MELFRDGGGGWEWSGKSGFGRYMYSPAAAAGECGRGDEWRNGRGGGADAGAAGFACVAVAGCCRDAAGERERVLAGARGRGGGFRGGWVCAGARAAGGEDEPGEYAKRELVRGEGDTFSVVYITHEPPVWLAKRAHGWVRRGGVRDGLGQGWKRDDHWMELGIIVFVGAGGCNIQMMLLMLDWGSEESGRVNVSQRLCNDIGIDTPTRPEPEETLGRMTLLDLARISARIPPTLPLPTNNNDG